MTNLLVADFHDTLCTGNRTATLESSNLSLEHFGRKERFTYQDIEKLDGKAWGDYFRFLCPSVGDDEIESLVTQAITYDNIVIPKYVRPMEGAIELLETIKKNGDYVTIASMCQEDALRDHYYPIVGISHLVDHTIVITDKILKIGRISPEQVKADALKVFLQDKQFQKKVIVGDKESDIIAGNMTELTTFFFSPEGKTCQLAEYSIRDLRDILSFLYKKD